MAKKEPVIKTKRLILQPMTNEEIKQLCETASEEELRKAYAQMLSGCESDVANRIWYAPWKMTLKREASDKLDRHLHALWDQHWYSIGFLGGKYGNRYQPGHLPGTMYWSRA